MDRAAKRAYDLFRRYGLTIDDYDVRLANQDYACAICGVREPRGKGAFHVDHDRDCCAGKRSCGECIRGLLCHHCNTFLGLARESTEILTAAADYLIKHAKGVKPARRS